MSAARATLCSSLALLLALAVPALGSTSTSHAQVDEPPVVDPAVSPRLPAVPEALREDVQRARRLVRRLNRCRTTRSGSDWGYGREGWTFGPQDCIDWDGSIEGFAREVQIHAFGLEYVRNAMVEWPASSEPRFYEWHWLGPLGRVHGPSVRRPHFHDLQVPYLVRALSVLTRDTDRHRVNAEEVIHTLGEVTLAPVTAQALEGHAEDPPLERRRLVREAWLRWFEERSDTETLDETRARGLATAEGLLDSSDSFVVGEAFFIRWRLNRRRADWAVLCRRVLRAPALTGGDRRRIVGRCAYARIGFREAIRLRREAEAARREQEEAPSSEPAP